jgi:hypothetical protein
MQIGCQFLPLCFSLSGARRGRDTRFGSPPADCAAAGMAKFASAAPAASAAGPGRAGAFTRTALSLRYRAHADFIGLTHASNPHRYFLPMPAQTVSTVPMGVMRAKRTAGLPE